MGLFINKRLHPDVYKKTGEIKMANQNSFKIDPLAEWMKEQNKATAKMNENIVSLDKSLVQTKNKQLNQWRSIGHQLRGLSEQNAHQVNFEKKVLESLNELKAKNDQLQEMLANERILNNEFVEKINTLSVTNSELVSQLDKSQIVSESLASKMDEQIERQKTLSQEYAKQEVVQMDVLQRLDAQEGLTEKMLRQLDYIRTVIFERTSFLAEHIERIYKVASSKKMKTKLQTTHSSKIYKIEKQEDEKNVN